ncbi:transposase, partial [uncultured Thomasclavelia sp.]|uniref:IS256 family transposase n=1 Tax=uncultured Thomasclavelia sp. TaxID=3025759 RepID=UPI00280AD4AB
MSKVSKELLRSYIKEQNFKSSNDVLAAMKEMFADVLQEALEAEMDTHLGYDRYYISEKSTDNSRNGYSKKTVKSELGDVELNMPRDRKGEFEPQIVPKHQRNITGLDEKILSLYAKGMTTTDIKEQIRELYDIEISAETVSNITSRIMPLVSEWQNRPLEKTYSFVFMDAIHYKVREDNVKVNTTYDTSRMNVYRIIE